MGKYIEKHKAVNLLTSLENEFQQFKPFKGLEHAMYRKLCETEIAIGKLPAADVVPVVHGEWVRPHWRNSNFCYDCSVCGNEVMHQEYRWRDKKIYPIYPWCGAKMDGGADNG